jgi:hypothetical protein
MAKRPGGGLRHLRLAPEWLGQSGLWLKDAGDGVFDAIGAEEAGFSESLADRLEDWMDEFDSIFDDADPLASRFASAAQYEAWRREGEAIAAAIRAALGPGETLDVQLPDGLGPDDAS